MSGGRDAMSSTPKSHFRNQNDGAIDTSRPVSKSAKLTEFASVSENTWLPVKIGLPAVYAIRLKKHGKVISAAITTAAYRSRTKRSSEGEKARNEKVEAMNTHAPLRPN